MKKIIGVLMTMAVTLIVGFAYAGGNSYESVPMNPALEGIGTAAAVKSVESVSAGGLREKGWVANTGRSYDSIPMNPALDEIGPKTAVSGASAGGFREKGWVANTGRSFDTVPMNPALE